MKLSPRFLLLCGMLSLGANNSLASEKSIFIDHQISQEIVLDELSESSKQNIPQILWQNMSSVTQHFSDLFAEIYEKNQQLDVSAEIQSFLQLPDYDALGTLPAFWIETSLGTDGSGNILFEVPSYWYQMPEEHESGTIDWNGLSGEMDFDPEFSAWDSKMNVNGLIVDMPDSFKYQLSPSRFLANYSNQNGKPVVETTLNLPEMRFEQHLDSEKLAIEYFQMTNRFLPEQYLPTAFNTTLNKLCYQKALSSTEKKIFNLFDFMAEFKARDTGAKLLNLPAQTNFMDLLDLLDDDETDFASFINVMAFRPIEASVKFEQLSLHEAGFKAENNCESPEKLPENLDNYQDALLHVEMKNFEYNGRSVEQDSGLELKNALFHLGNTLFKTVDFATKFEQLKLAITSNVEENATDLVQSSLDINIKNFELPNILAKDENLNTKLSLGVQHIDAEVLLELQQFIKNAVKDFASEDDSSMFGFALLGKYMELTPKLIKRSPAIYIKGLDDKEFSISLSENNNLSGSISLNIDGSQFVNLFDQETLLSALHSNIKVELKLTQAKANQLISYVFEIDEKQAAEMIAQWAAMFEVAHEGENYTLKLNMCLEQGKLVGKNSTSTIIASLLQPFLVGE
ncbi:MAG: DUF945 family protein [Thiotrichaceae bacterium]|nr:DUF945 family protein [Thiotrichaceae bacterium]